MLVYLGISLWAVLLGTRVCRYDLYHKPPRTMLLAAFVLGLAAMWLLGHVEDLTAAGLGITLHDFSGQALVAAAHEEFATLVIVVCLALAWRRRFDGPLDGLIAGSFAGLGMAVEESLFYLSLSGRPGFETLGVEVVRLLLHVLLGGLSGFAVARAAARAKHWPWALAGWWTASATLHFLWDCWVGVPRAEWGSSNVEPRVAAVALAVVAMTLFGTAVVVGSRRSREKFAPQSSRSLWAWPFVAAWDKASKPRGGAPILAMNSRTGSPCRDPSPDG
jgi:RsiW-degrading membrane proteinase PrsW (M82 family)